MKGIGDEKLRSLINEGFNEKYIRSILKFKPSPDNPEVDMNAEIRDRLGINYKPVTMTNHGLSVIPKRRGF